MIGTTIQHYRITEILGEGGMGEVFKAVDLELDRVVAVKCMRKELSGRSDLAARFRSEARMLAKLDHPNVATVYRFFEHEDQLFLVMEYVAGKSFGDLMKSKRGLGVDEAIPLFAQALSGIGYAHQQGVVHRDLKPSNLMRDERGLVKVLDFGIAHLVGSSRMTKTGMAVGTPAYMAPEQVRGKEIDPRTDLYSLGIVFYEMLTGQLPFEANSDFEAMRAHLEEQPRDISQLSPQVPEDIQEAIYRALAKESDSRFSTAAEFAQALGHDSATAPVATPTLARKRPATDALRDLGDRLRELEPVHWVGGVAALLGVALVVLLLLRATSGNDTTLAGTGATPAPTVVGTPAAGTNGGTVGTPAAGIGVSPAGGGATTASAGGATSGSAEGSGSPPAAETAGTAGTSTAAGAGLAATGGAGSAGEATSAPSSGGGAASGGTAGAAAGQTTTPKASPPVVASVPRARASITKISVHSSMRRSGAFAKAAGYNAVVDVKGRGSEMITEVVEARRDGRLVLKETIASERRPVGRYRTKHRVAALKGLDPGTYDVRLVILAGGKQTAKHSWSLVIK